MVINETLRIHPPAPALNARISQKEERLGEYVIPRGIFFFNHFRHHRLLCYLKTKFFIQVK